MPNGARIINSYDTTARMTATVLLNSTNCILNSHSDNLNLGSQRTHSVRKAGDYIDYSYDNIGQLSSALAKEGGGADRALEQLRYVYDSAGNLRYSTNNALIQTFKVNALNQLTNVTRTGTMTVAGTTTSAATNVAVNTSNSVLYLDYTFASTNHNLSDGTNTFTAVGKDNLGRVDTNTSVVYLPSSPTFAYDANGNLTYDGLKSYEWDDENQLTRLTATNAWKSEFAYDGKMRRRLRREYTWQSSAWVLTNEVRYIYDGTLVIQERNNLNLATVTYTRGVDLSRTLERAGGIGGLLARTDNADLSIKPCAAHAYYHADGNGNVTCLVNSNQLVCARYLYDPFGTILAMSGLLAEANLYRFSSKEFHEPSGLLYYLYRYYDARLARWINRDPIGEAAGLNLYAYVDNDPINNLDFLGLAEHGDFGETWHPMPSGSIVSPPPKGVTVVNPPPIRIMPGGGLVEPTSPSSSISSAMGGLPSMMSFQYDDTTGVPVGHTLFQIKMIFFNNPPPPTMDQLMWDLKYSYKTECPVYLPGRPTGEKPVAVIENLWHSGSVANVVAKATGTPITPPNFSPFGVPYVGGSVNSVHSVKW